MYFYLRVAVDSCSDSRDICFYAQRAEDHIQTDFDFEGRNLQEIHMPYLFMSFWYLFILGKNMDFPLDFPIRQQRGIAVEATH